MCDNKTTSLSETCSTTSETSSGSSSDSSSSDSDSTMEDASMQIDDPEAIAESRVPPLPLDLLTELPLRAHPDRYRERALEEEDKGDLFRSLQFWKEYSLSMPADQIREIDRITMTRVCAGLIFSVKNDRFAVGSVLKYCLMLLNQFPQNCKLLNVFCAYLVQYDVFEVAWSRLHKAVEIGHLPAEKNLMHMYWKMVPRWHFRMLNDKRRNSSYKQAINKAINKGYDKVFDIGAGCGLLTFIAAGLKSTVRDVKVVAFEESKVLHKMAKQHIDSYPQLNNVTLLLKNSNRFRNDFGNRYPCNLIVTEIFDAGIFGEGCLETIYHAITTFPNLKRGFRIIPEKAHLFVQGFNSARVSSEHHFLNHQSSELLGIDPDKLCLKFDSMEPYDAEFLKKVKDVAYTTEVVKVLDVDFYNALELAALMGEETAYFKSFTLKANQDTVLRTIAIWFQLDLDKKITLNTHPKDANVDCWEQGVVHLEHPVEVKADQSIEVHANLKDDQFTLKVVSPLSVCLSNQRTCLSVTQQEIIRMLNDAPLIDALKRLADKLVISNVCNQTVVDYSYFPIFGYFMAKRGVTAYHVYRHHDDLRFFQYFLDANDFDRTQMIFVGCDKSEALIFSLKNISYIFMDPIEMDGSWNQLDYTANVEEHKQNLILPSLITVQACFIYSAYLDTCNKVEEKNVFKCGISNLMNQFSGWQHPGIKPDEFEYEHLSTVASISGITVANEPCFGLEGQVTILKTGTVNGILFWYEFNYHPDYPDCTFNTRKSSYYDKCCTILEKPLDLKKGSRKLIKVSKQDFHLKVYCD